MISFILAMDKNRGIGVDNKLPWRLPEDLKYFKRVTMGAPVVMGRKTFESIGNKPLPGRPNIVVTRDRSYEAPAGAQAVHAAEEVLSQYSKEQELFVIGGTEIFRLFMPYADRMYITEINEQFPADTHFPEIDKKEWKEVSRERGVKDELNPYEYDFVLYERVRS